MSTWLSVTLYCRGAARLSLLHRFVPAHLQNSAHERHLDSVSLLEPVIRLDTAVGSFCKEENF